MTPAVLIGKGRALSIRLLEGTHSAGVPIFVQLYTQLREHILTGVLRPESRLPSSRMLAADLGISRNTVEAAYQQLQAEGFTQSRIGAGTVVAATIADVVPFRRQAGMVHASRVRSALQSPSCVAARLSSRGSTLVRLGEAELVADRYNGACLTDVERFPAKLWNRLLARQARRGGAVLFRPGDPRGTLALRRAIAEYAQLSRGVRCDAEQVVIVNSTQQAVDLAGRILLDPNDLAVIEDPAYPSARSALQAIGARLHAVPVDDEGLVTAHLSLTRDPKLLYVTPSHQFPLGVTMSLPRRLAVLTWAAANGVWILEDDYDSEFHYAGRPIAALQGLDRSGRVLYVGTFNKVLFPGLRIAYLIVPPELVGPFVATRRLTDGVSSPLTQAVLAEFISGGFLAAHLRFARQHYALRRNALVKAIDQHWGAAARLGPSKTGLHLVAHFADGTDDGKLTTCLPDTLGVGLGALSQRSRRLFGANP